MLRFYFFLFAKPFLAGIRRAAKGIEGKYNKKWKHFRLPPNCFLANDKILFYARANVCVCVWGWGGLGSIWKTSRKRSR